MCFLAFFIFQKSLKKIEQNKFFYSFKLEGFWFCLFWNFQNFNFIAIFIKKIKETKSAYINLNDQILKNDQIINFIYKELFFEIKVFMKILKF